MFDLRLGLALGKSLEEIRALPYPEYKEWYLYSQIEPFGWHDREYRTAAQLSMLHNVNAKPKHQKPVTYFIRNMPKLLAKYFAKERNKVVYDLSTEEGRRKATERAVNTLKQMFGAVDKR